MSKSTFTKDYRTLLVKLKAARAAASLTQDEAAKLLGKPQSYVSKCEQGERRIDVIELKAFARIYGKPLAFFTA